MGVPTEPIGSAERAPLGVDPFSRPIFSFSPLEPSDGVLLAENGTPILTEAGEFIGLDVA